MVALELLVVSSVQGALDRLVALALQNASQLLSEDPVCSRMTMLLARCQVRSRSDSVTYGSAPWFLTPTLCQWRSRRQHRLLPAGARSHKVLLYPLLVLVFPHQLLHPQWVSVLLHPQWVSVHLRHWLAHPALHPQGQAVCPGSMLRPLQTERLQPAQAGC